MAAATEAAACIFAALVALAGCGAAESPEEEPSVDYEVLDAQAQPLRDAFNADSASVRVLMLASPT